MIITPCNYLHKEIDPKGQEIDKNCTFDKEKQFEYVSTSLDMKLYFNTERFNP